MRARIFVIVDVRLDVDAVHATDGHTVVFMKRELHIRLAKLILFKAAGGIPMQSKIGSRLRIKLALWAWFASAWRVIQELPEIWSEA